MKQIIQDLKTGETILEEVPAPKVKRGHVLIKTHRSLVSLGTERMLVEFGKANLLEKTLQQPDKVKMVLEKMKTDGFRPTVEAVFRKLNEPIALGYCNAGEVIDVGAGVHEFKIGDRVISNGHHAEIVCVPENLVAKIPDHVPYDDASFTVIGAIALQGIRLLKMTFGECVVVTGLGLIGLIATQLLKAHGCHVIGLDFDERKVEIAKSWGITAFQVGNGMDPVQLVMEETGNVGADAVLIAASTKSNDVIAQSAHMCRKRGRIVLVGVIGLNLKRADFYEKELSFQVSCSYGPGRYDDNYEIKGNDYPLPYVRWTEKRNFEAILNALANQSLKVDKLVTEKVELDAYHRIYSNISNSSSIASILKYSENAGHGRTSVQVANKTFSGQKGVLGIIGAGNFTKSTIVPNLKKLGARIKYISSSRGLSGTMLAKKYDIAFSTTNNNDILDDPEVDAVIITTRHDQHANLVIQALNAGKHVFVEKPLALTFEELDRVAEAYHKNACTLTVGFNRRFSPFAVDAKNRLGSSGSDLNVIATMNAGFVPSDSWVHDVDVGGGRIIGEACHLIDLITFWTGSLVKSVVMNARGENPESNTDNASILLRYQNGAQGVINYFANGSKAYSKERFEIYSQNRTIVIDNFRKSRYYGFKKKSLKKSQDKGHNQQFKSFVEKLEKGGNAIIPYEEIMNTSKAVIAAIQSLKSGTWVDVE